MKSLIVLLVAVGQSVRVGFQFGQPLLGQLGHRLRDHGRDEAVGIERLTDGDDANASAAQTTEEEVVIDRGWSRTSVPGLDRRGGRRKLET